VADYYQVLEVEKYVSDKQLIKSAYKRLAIKYHPDKNPNNKDAEEKFKEINEAYHTLIDEEKKKLYDLYLYLLSQPVSTNNIIPPKTSYNQFQRKNYQYYQYRQQNRVRYEKEEARSKKYLHKVFFLSLIGVIVVFGGLFVWRHLLDLKEAKELYEQGIVSMKEGRPGQAYSLLNRSIDLKKSSDTYFAIAEIELLVYKDYPAALHNLQLAISYSDHFNPAFFFKRGYCLYLQKQYEGAIDDFNKLINNKNFQDEAYFFRASSFYYLKNNEQACVDWLKASELGMENSKDSLNIYCK